MATSKLTLLSSMALRELLAELVADYERTTSESIEAQAAGGVEVAKRVQAGAAADVVVLSAEAIDKLVTEGALVPGSRVDLAKSPIAVAVRAGAPRPDISSAEAVRRAVTAAATLSYSTGPSGKYLEHLFERWGVPRPRIVVPPPGTPVASLVALGQAEIGFQQLSELRSYPGIEVIGLLPADIQVITIFSGAITTTSSRPAGARALLDFMASPSSLAAKLRYGLESA